MQPDYYGDEPAQGASPDPYAGYGAKPIQESRLPLYLTFIVLGVICFFAFRYIATKKPIETVQETAPPTQAALPSEPTKPVAVGGPGVATPQQAEPAYRPPQAQTAVEWSAPRPQQSDQTSRPGDKSPGWKARALLESSNSDE